jgi:hypothetical protein
MEVSSPGSVFCQKFVYHSCLAHCSHAVTSLEALSGLVQYSTLRKWKIWVLNTSLLATNNYVLSAIPVAYAVELSRRVGKNADLRPIQESTLLPRMPSNYSVGSLCITLIEKSPVHSMLPCRHSYLAL